MRLEHMGLLVCPHCQSSLRLTDVKRGDSLTVEDGTLVSEQCNQEFPIVNGVPRFVPRENYASGFGLEWTKHARTQYDSYSRVPLSERRFFDQTHWPRDLSGQVVLEVGSGSGRFTEQAAATGATVVSFDYSYAVDANQNSNGRHPNVLVVQADVFAMPFRPSTFDKLFCFGMLQHTPDPARAFAALPGMLKPGGMLCADIYSVALLRTFLHTKYLVRPFTRSIPPERLYAMVTRWVDLMWPLAGIIRKLPKGHGINWRLLVADYSNFGLTGNILKEWAYLDTFDMLAPRYDRPARIDTFKGWAETAGLLNIEAESTGHGLVLRARVA
jgi:SAM-dependent methyltransferase/uncharacterized protein YbaR (Trm112 family)